MFSIGLTRVLIPLMLLGLPLVGAWLAGQPLTPYLAFPPIPESWDSQSFSWLWFIAAAVVVAGGLSPLVIRVIASQSPLSGRMSYPAAFPRWGWWSVGIVVLTWILAWNRFPWFASLQPYTFTVLWVGYIGAVNGLTFQRTGHCAAVDRPRQILVLFPLSALFWWFFEYLNLFAHNWYYVGSGQSISGIRYFLVTSLPFSTVLPAVLSTRDLLASFPRLSAGLDNYHRVPVPFPRLLAGAALLAGMAGLVGIGLWPAYLFPAVWVAPLLLLVALQALAGRSTFLSPLQAGDWRPLWLPAIAALACGFFWEMWNVYSLSRWEYALPQVHGFLLFEMPLLGYAGYLPFGLTCIAAIDCFLPAKFDLHQFTYRQIFKVRHVV